MPRNLSLLVVLGLAASALPVEAQSKARKKDVPRVLRAGDEVRLFVPLAVATRGDGAAASSHPNAAKAGVIGPDFLVLAVFQRPTRGEDSYWDRLDDMAHDALVDAARIGDRAAVDRMLAEGRARKVTDGTRLFVTYRSPPGSWDCRARILDGPDAGKIIEVPVRNVR